MPSVASGKGSIPYNEPSMVGVFQFDGSGVGRYSDCPVRPVGRLPLPRPIWAVTVLLPGSRSTAATGRHSWAAWELQHVPIGALERAARRHLRDQFDPFVKSLGPASTARHRMTALAHGPVPSDDRAVRLARLALLYVETLGRHNQIDVLAKSSAVSRDQCQAHRNGQERVPDPDRAGKPAAASPTRPTDCIKTSLSRSGRRCLLRSRNRARQPQADWRARSTNAWDQYRPR